MPVGRTPVSLTPRVRWNVIIIADAVIIVIEGANFYALNQLAIVTPLGWLERPPALFPPDDGLGPPVSLPIKKYAYNVHQLTAANVVSFVNNVFP